MDFFLSSARCLGGPDGWDEGDGKGEVIGGFLVGWKGWSRAKVLACLLACLLGRRGYGVGERCLVGYLHCVYSP